MGNIDREVEKFIYSLKLDPDNQNAKMPIQELDKKKE